MKLSLFETYQIDAKYELADGEGKPHIFEFRIDTVPRSGESELLRVPMVMFLMWQVGEQFRVNIVSPERAESGQ